MPSWWITFQPKNRYFWNWSTKYGCLIELGEFPICVFVPSHFAGRDYIPHHVNDDVTNMFSMMTSSNGNIFRITGPLCGEFTGPGEFPTQRPVTRSFDVFFDLRLNKRLSKQPWGWWFEPPSWSLWRHRNGQWQHRLHLRAILPFADLQRCNIPILIQSPGVVSVSYKTSHFNISECLEPTCRNAHIALKFDNGLSIFKAIAKLPNTNLTN